MASFSSEPGLVWCGHATSAQPCPEPVAGPSWPRTSPSVRRPPSSLTSSSPKRRNLATSSPITGASPLRVGAPSTAQQNRSPSTTSCPYWGTRGRRGRTTLGTSPCPSALRAVSYTHLRAHETDSYLVCRLLLEK